MVPAGRAGDVQEMVVVVVAVRVLPVVGCRAVVECLPHRCFRLVVSVVLVGRRLLVVFVLVGPESLSRRSLRRLLPNVPECRSRRRCLSSTWRASECDCLQVLLLWATMERESGMVSLIRRTA